MSPRVSALRMLNVHRAAKQTLKTFSPKALTSHLRVTCDRQDWLCLLVVHHTSMVALDQGLLIQRLAVPMLFVL